MKILETRFAGVDLQNPVMNASGTFDMAYGEYFDLSGMGAIVAKGVSPSVRRGNAGERSVETPCGMLNAIGLEGAGIDAFLSRQLPEYAKAGVPVIVNFSASSPAEYGDMAARLDVQGVAMIEANVSCPNVSDGGMAFGTSADSIKRVVDEIKKKSAKPLIVKLTPSVAGIAVMAKAAEDAGADAVSLINTLKGMVIDTRRMQPFLGNKTGGLSGPAIRPVAVSMVYETYVATKLPIIGMGGIAGCGDALQFMMAGASAVAVGSAGFANKRAIPETIRGLADYAEKMKLGNISEIVGAAHRAR
jgi:dihydroorotate dehydrogenase (NAD+) catalytic subunit